MKPYVLHLVAEQELAEAVADYDARRPGLGRRLYDAVDATISRVRTHPLMYAADADGVRIAPVDGFSYSVVYVDFPTYVWIASISHNRRRPGHWASRRPDDV